MKNPKLLQLPVVFDTNTNILSTVNKPEIDELDKEKYYFSLLIPELLPELAKLDISENEDIRNTQDNKFQKLKQLCNESFIGLLPNEILKQLVNMFDLSYDINLETIYHKLNALIQLSDPKNVSADMQLTACFMAFTTQCSIEVEYIKNNKNKLNSDFDFAREHMEKIQLKLTEILTCNTFTTQGKLLAVELAAATGNINFFKRIAQSIESLILDCVPLLTEQLDYLISSFYKLWTLLSGTPKTDYVRLGPTTPIYSVYYLLGQHKQTSLLIWLLKNIRTYNLSEQLFNEDEFIKGLMKFHHDVNIQDVIKQIIREFNETKDEQIKNKSSDEPSTINVLSMKHLPDALANNSMTQEEFDRQRFILSIKNGIPTFSTQYDRLRKVLIKLNFYHCANNNVALQKEVKIHSDLKDGKIAIDFFMTFTLEIYPYEHRLADILHYLCTHVKTYDIKVYLIQHAIKSYQRLLHAKPLHEALNFKLNQYVLRSLMPQNNKENTSLLLIQNYELLLIFENLTNSLFNSYQISINEIANDDLHRRNIIRNLHTGIVELITLVEEYDNLFANHFLTNHQLWLWFENSMKQDHGTNIEQSYFKALVKRGLFNYISAMLDLRRSSKTFGVILSDEFLHYAFIDNIIKYQTIICRLLLRELTDYYTRENANPFYLVLFNAIKLQRSEIVDLLTHLGKQKQIFLSPTTLFIHAFMTEYYGMMPYFLKDINDLDKLIKLFNEKYPHLHVTDILRFHKNLIKMNEEPSQFSQYFQNHLTLAQHANNLINQWPKIYDGFYLTYLKLLLSDKYNITQKNQDLFINTLLDYIFNEYEKNMFRWDAVYINKIVTLTKQKYPEKSNKLIEKMNDVAKIKNNQAQQQTTGFDLSQPNETEHVLSETIPSARLLLDFSNIFQSPRTTANELQTTQENQTTQSEISRDNDNFDEGTIHLRESMLKQPNSNRTR